MHKVAILQARLSSSRLPRKVLAELSGRSVVAHIIDRLRAARRVDEVCVAIPADDHETPLAEALAKLDVTVVRGSQHDVLGRFIQAAYSTRADLIVRCTADNPLVSFDEIDRQLAELEADEGLDYLITEGYPVGITPEAFTFKALEKLDYLARHAHMREHVTLYARENPGPFAVKKLEAPRELYAPDLSLTLDTQQDLDMFEAIYRYLYRKGHLVRLEEVFELIRRETSEAALSRAVASLAVSA